jgi:hypothetical protein
VPREFGGRSKRSEKKLRKKKITLHHRADYFIQNLIFHYFIEKKRGRVTERGREEGGDTFLRPMEYVIGFFINEIFSIISHFSIWYNDKYE